jgi:hypothetical protein
MKVKERGGNAEGEGEDEEKNQGGKVRAWKRAPAPEKN